MRQFELGKWLRTRYNYFLSESYSPNEILVVSSDVDRCHMSAQTNLAGLFTPTGSSVWLEDLLWEPVPIHSTPQDEDIFLLMNMNCPKFQKLIAEVDNLPFFQNILIEYADLLQYLTDKTTLSIESLTHVSHLWQVFYIYEQHNDSFVPSWVYSIDPKNFTYLAGLGFTRESYSHELKRFKTGPFFHYLISHFETVLSASDFPKFLMLSAHDGTIANVLNSMSAFDFMPPEFAAALIWELHKNVNGEYYISMFYKKPKVFGLKEIVLDGCDFVCSFNNFKTILGNISVDESTWKEECNS